MQNYIYFTNYICIYKNTIICDPKLANTALKSNFNNIELVRNIKIINLTSLT